MDGCVRFGSFEFDPSGRVLRRNGLKLRVPCQSLEILAALVEHPGETVTRSRIRTLLWPHGTVVGFDQSISAAMRRLRHAIGDPAVNPRFIERVPRQGYRFIAPVERLPVARGGPTQTSPSLARYKLSEKVGEGSTGEVWKAWDVALDRALAIKFIPDHVITDAAALEAFRSEARHAGALTHANICTIHGLEEQDGRLFLVMEYIEGRPLDALVTGEPFPIARILDIGRQAAAALAAAHAAEIVHRDIKPANFILATEGRLKLTDFSIARRIETGDPKPSSSPRQSPTGTLEYMSPEQARGEAADHRSDLFSLGVVLYELATGNVPFQGPSAAAVLDAVQFERPRPPRTLNARVPRALERVILRALEKDPAARWQNATDIVDALRRIENGVTTRRSLVRSGLVGIATITAMVVTAWLWPRPQPALADHDAVVVAEFDNSTGDDVFDAALRQALLSQIGQSSHVSLVSEERVRRTLALARRPQTERFSRAVAQDVCRRLGAKAVLAGSVGRVGARYFVGLDAVGCADGRSIGETYVEARTRDGVLTALSTAASAMRGKLGESLASIRARSVPAEATTRSLEALNAYSLALAEKARGHDVRGLLERAIELDPEFASALFTLAQVNFNRGEESNTEEFMSRAFVLRDRVSERERLYIETGYHTLVSGDNQQAIAAATLLARLYPHEPAARRAPFLPYCIAGDLGPAQQIAARELEFAPEEAVSYFNMAIILLGQQKTAEARAVLEQGRARGLTTEWSGFARYIAAALDGDVAALERETENARANPLDVRLMALQAQTAGYFGQLDRASELVRIASSGTASPESGAAASASVALVEALVGREQDAQRRANAAVRITRARRTVASAALALAFADDTRQAAVLLGDLQRRYPRHELLRRGYVVAIRGAIALSRGDPQQAIRETHTLENVHETLPIWSTYVRGLAYLRLGEGRKAAAAFQAILDHKGLLFTASTFYGAAVAYPVSQVGLARALALDGQTDASRIAYERFLEGWTRADSSIPLLVQAKREYAALVRAADRGRATRPRLKPCRGLRDVRRSARALIDRVRSRRTMATTWAMLPTVCTDEHMFGFNAPPDPLGRAQAAARRAVELSPTSALASQALAQSLFFRKGTGRLPAGR